MVYASIAFRNLGRQKRRTILLAAAISFGVFIITLINGFTAGIVRNVEQNLAQLTSGHIFLRGREITGSGREINLIRDDTGLEQAVSAVKKETGDTIVAVTKRSSFMGTLVFGGRSYMQKVEGVDWNSETDFRNSLVVVSGSLSDATGKSSIVISLQAAERLGVQVGETLLARLSTVTGQANIGEFKVAALTADTGLLGSFSAYARLDEVSSLLNMEAGDYQQMTILLEGINDIDRVAPLLYAELAKRVQMSPMEDTSTSGSMDSGGPEKSMGRMMGFNLNEETEIWTGVKYDMSTLNDLLANFKSVVSVLNIVGLTILLILLLITMVGIVNTFRMIMLERTKEIGTMRAIGVQRNGVRRIFLFEAFFLASVGVACGFVIALVVMAGIGIFGFPTTSPLYMFTTKGHLSFNLLPLQVSSNYLLVGLLSMAAAFFPARKASKIEPAAALRQEN